MSHIHQANIVRHTHNYDVMVSFYKDFLGMRIKTSWDQPENRGTLLAFGK